MIKSSLKRDSYTGKLKQFNNCIDAGIVTIGTVSDYIFRVNSDNIILDGTRVMQMTNVGTNGINLIQYTTAYQPLIVSNEANGHSAIAIDAIDDMMTCTQFSLAGDFTQFYVYKQVSLPGKITFFNNNVYESTMYAYDGLFYINYGPGNFREWVGMSGSTDYVVLMVKRVSSSHYAYINNVLVSSVLGFGTGVYDINTAFYQSSFKNTSTLYLLDATMFNYALTTQQGTDFYQLLKNTYGL